MRVVVAGLYHETNTFLDGTAGLDEFEELRGQELFGQHGEGSPLAGVLEEAARRGWTVLPVIDLRAMPGPTVADSVVARFIEVLDAGLDGFGQEGYDAILLVLHGAMVSESCADVEGLILARVRARIGDTIPLAAVLDLHANCTPEMAAAANVLVAYRENPHTDGRDCGARTAALLDRVVREKIAARCILRNAPVVWPPTGTGTANEPMAGLERTARGIEASDGSVLAMNVLAGFAFADVRWAGVSFCCVTSGCDEDAERHLDRLEALALATREAGNPGEHDLDEVLSEIEGKAGGLYLLIEAADNIGAGTSGRGLGVLEGFLRRGFPNTAVAIQAPECVAQMRDNAPGETVDFALADVFSGKRLKLRGTLLSKSDGRFRLEDPHSHLASMGGSTIEMGDCAVVRVENVSILLTSRRTPPFDLGQFRSQGIVPEELFAVGIKAAVAHRQAWEPVAAGSYWVDVAGPCSSNLRRLPYRKIRRPIYPLDDSGFEKGFRGLN